MSWDYSQKARLKRAGIALLIPFCLGAFFLAIALPTWAVQWLADNGYTAQAWGVGILGFMAFFGIAGYFVCE